MEYPRLDEEVDSMMQSTATDLDLQPFRRNLYPELSRIISSSQTEGRTSVGSANMLVYIRIKPLTDEESECSQCVVVEGAGSVLLKRVNDANIQRPITSRRFTFSRVYGPDTTQKCLFDGTMKPLVNNFLSGQNCLVFTYGVTNSGKTYTVQGIPGNYGLLPRALSVLFNSLNGLIDYHPKWRPHMSCSAIALSQQQVKCEEATKMAILAAAASKKFPAEFGAVS
uniref:kinesin-like protein KIF20A n=1 Tax=Myxine glutinosa TaxID=7769 RepID=UPI00358FFFCD